MERTSNDSDEPVGEAATSSLDLAHAPFFLVLQRLGRQVLRPGGRVATRRLVEALGIGPEDDVVELAAGVGSTGRAVLAAAPRSYVAVEPEPRFRPRLAAALGDGRGRVLAAPAEQSGLPSGCADVVLAEAMLTMQTAAKREQIVAEAARLLRPGGRCGIHELAALSADPRTLADLRRDLARATRVNASPPPPAEWRRLLGAAGLEVRQVETLPLRLLSLRGLVADEGMGALAVLARLARYPQARRRVRRMVAVHRRHRRQLRAIVVVAQKPGVAAAGGGDGNGATASW